MSNSIGKSKSKTESQRKSTRNSKSKGKSRIKSNSKSRSKSKSNSKSSSKSTSKSKCKSKSNSKSKGLIPSFNRAIEATHRGSSDRSGASGVSVAFAQGVTGSVVVMGTFSHFMLYLSQGITIVTTAYYYYYYHYYYSYPRSVKLFLFIFVLGLTCPNGAPTQDTSSFPEIWPVLRIT